MARTFWTFKHVLRLGYDTYWFVEGDSIATAKAPTKLTDGIHCFRWENYQTEFRAKTFLHWALGLNRKSLTQLAEASDLYNPAQEQGFPDRLIALICEEQGIKIHHRPDISYSRNRLDRPEYVQQAQEAIRNGASFVHGLKTQDDLNTLFA